MKKLCFSLVCHEKVMIFGGFSSLGGRVITPAYSPGPGTSFLRFITKLKKLKFLSRKLIHDFFWVLSKNVLLTSFRCYNRISYTNRLDVRRLPVLLRKIRLAKKSWLKCNYIFWKSQKCVYYIRNDVPTPGEQI